MQPPTPSGFQRTLARLQLLARQLVEGFSTGLHKSPQRGASVTFKHHRPYVSGDEVRHIDWKVFARSDRYYIREYEQETSLRALLLLDFSGSMEYRGEASMFSKADYARQMALALATVLIGQQDAVGLVTFNTDIRSLIPPSTRPSHLQLLERTLLKEQPAGETSIAGVLSKAMPRLGRRSLLVLISDCLDDTSLLIKTLSQLRSQHHEVLVFQILDRDELEFPFNGWTRFESLETPGLHLDLDPAAIRASYLENLHRFQEELSKGCSRNRIQLFQCTTDEPLDQTLATHLRTRASRR